MSRIMCTKTIRDLNNLIFRIVLTHRKQLCSAERVPGDWTIIFLLWLIRPTFF